MRVSLRRAALLPLDSIAEQAITPLVPLETTMTYAQIIQSFNKATADVAELRAKLGGPTDAEAAAVAMRYPDALGHTYHALITVSRDLAWCQATFSGYDDRSGAGAVWAYDIELHGVFDALAAIIDEANSPRHDGWFWAPEIATRIMLVESGIRTQVSEWAEMLPE